MQAPPARPSRPSPPDVRLEPLAQAHAERLRELRAGPGVMRWWGPIDDGFPFDDPAELRYAIVLGAEVVGLVQFGEEREPEYRHAWLDIFVGDDYAGRGVGTAAIREALRIAFEERGHHRVMIDPEVGNAAAIRCYEKCGFEHVGVMHASAFNHATGRWEESLLMELVRPQLARPLDAERRPL